MSEEDRDAPDNLDNSIDGEFKSGDSGAEGGAKSDNDFLGASSGSEAEFRAKKQRMQTPSPKPSPLPFMVQASPPKFVTFEDLMSAANGVKNMSLAHEIAVDANFKLEKIEPPQKSIAKTVKEVVHRAFWDAFQEKITEDPPDFSQAVVLIQEVKESLMSILLPQHMRLKAQLNEVLDSELIEQKLENDAFDIYYYSDYVINIMSKLCAPARDERITKLKEMKDVIPLFKEIFEVLDLMKMDMANFTIQQIRPYIQQQSVEYERKKFEEFLKTQQETRADGLELTKLWLSRSFEKLHPGGETSSEGASNTTSQVTPAAILNGAYMEILLWDDSHIFPETLVLDQGRFLELRDKTSHLTLVTSILLVTYNTVGEAIAGVQSLKTKLKEQICTLLEGVGKNEVEGVMVNVGEQVNKEVNGFLKEHGFAVRDETQQKMLIGQIKDLTSKDQPIISLMSKRVIAFIQQALFHRHMEPIKVPAGMSVMEQELSQICGQFLRLISHNRSVFGNFYADIIGALLKRDQTDLSPRPV